MLNYHCGSDVMDIDEYSVILNSNEMVFVLLGFIVLAGIIILIIFLRKSKKSKNKDPQEEKKDENDKDKKDEKA